MPPANSELVNEISNTMTLQYSRKCESVKKTKSPIGPGGGGYDPLICVSFDILFVFNLKLFCYHSVNIWFRVFLSTFLRL